MKPEVGDRDDAALVRDHVLHPELPGGGDDLGPARRGVLLPHLEELALDEGEQLGLGLEDAAQFLDQLHEAEVLGLDLAALEAGQLVEAQLEDGVRLALREGVLRHQADLRLVAVGGGADDLHEVVQVIEGDDVALEDVGAVLGLAQAEARAARDDVPAVLDVALDQLLDVHLLRPLAVEREERDAEGGLERRLLEELVDDDLGLLAALELDDDARVLVGLVAQVADAVDLLLRDELGDARDQVRPVHVVGDLRDDDLLHAALQLLGVGLAADADDSLAGLQVAQDRLAPGDDAARREVGPLDDAADLVHADGRPVHDRAGRVDDLVRLCGGMLVAMPTAIPVDPFMRRLGSAAGSTVGSVVDSL
jgi:hypothetical protein